MTSARDRTRHTLLDLFADGRWHGRPASTSSANWAWHLRQLAAAGCTAERRRVGHRVEVRPAPAATDAWREAIEEADAARGYPSRRDLELLVRAEPPSQAPARRDLALVELNPAAVGGEAGWYRVEDLGPDPWPLPCPVRLRVQLIGEEGRPAITDVVFGGGRDGGVFEVTARALRLPLGRLLAQAVATRSPRRPFTTA
jgi:hypothetical protein